MTEDFYDLLELPSDASQDEIKDAYREKVRVYHPDVNDDDRARAQFTAVKKANEILGDPVERQAYDRLGHKDYVAKRTSGIPSPDVWNSDSDSDSAPSSSGSRTRTSTSSRSGSTASSSRSQSSRSQSRSRSGSNSDSRSRSGSSTSGTTGTTSATAGTSTSGSDSRTQSRSRSRSSSTDRDASTGAGTSASTHSKTNTSSGGATGSSETGSGQQTRSSTGDASATANTAATENTTADEPQTRRSANPLTRWWRRQNFSLPLIWLSVLVYALGLAHFALENDSALEGVLADVVALGTDIEAIWTHLVAGRHGIDSPATFVANIELVAAPVPALEWYGALAGVVAAALVIVLVNRLWRHDDPWGTITIDETIFIALALVISTTLVGGPLLAGAVLMPFLFGVVVHHTRLQPGWKPSYLYVVPVLAPIIGIGAGLAGYGLLPAELLAFVVLPLAGALGLPLRATIRKRFGR